MLRSIRWNHRLRLTCSPPRCGAGELATYNRRPSHSHCLKSIPPCSGDFRFALIVNDGTDLSAIPSCVLLFSIRAPPCGSKTNGSTGIMSRSEHRSIVSKWGPPISMRMGKDRLRRGSFWCLIAVLCQPTKNQVVRLHPLGAFRFILYPRSKLG
jgi:hypothetical protein